MGYGFKVLTPTGFTQIDPSYAALRVIESGTIASGTAMNFARAAGGLYLRATTLGASLYLSSNRRLIYASSGTISYIVVDNASTFAPSSGYGLSLKSSNGTLVFSNQMLFPRLVYSGLIASVRSTPLTLNLSTSYTGAHYYVSQYGLGLDSWQIGQSYITYRNIKMTTATDNSQVTFSSFMAQVSSTVGGYDWGANNTFTHDLNNYIQLIQV